MDKGKLSKKTVITVFVHFLCALIFAKTGLWEGVEKMTKREAVKFTALYERLIRLIPTMAKQENVTEVLKAVNQMEWGE